MTFVRQIKLGIDLVQPLQPAPTPMKFLKQNPESLGEEKKERKKKTTSCTLDCRSVLAQVLQSGLITTLKSASKFPFKPVIALISLSPAKMRALARRVHCGPLTKEQSGGAGNGSDVQLLLLTWAFSGPLHSPRDRTLACAAATPAGKSPCMT